jgi:ribosome-associated protein
MASKKTKKPKSRGSKKAAKKPSKKSQKSRRKKTKSAAPKLRAKSGSKNPLLNSILTQLNEDQAINTVQIDLQNKSTIADYMVVTSGRSSRHVSAIAEHVIENLHKDGAMRVRVEGMPHCDWVLIDAGDVILHIFRPEVRAFYNLEKMWARSSVHG